MDLLIVENLILMLHVMGALAITGLVLIQRGKGADMGSGFGSGASATVFGSGGAGNFLTRTTAIVAVVFFVTSFALAWFAKEKSESVADLGIPQIVEQIEEVEDVLIPVVDDLPDLAPAARAVDDEIRALPVEAESEIPQ